MLTYSPEAAFLLAVFALVLSGLPLVALAWIHGYEGTRVRGRGVLVAGFVLLCVAFAADALSHRAFLAPAQSGRSPFGWFVLLEDVARLAATASLGAAVLLRERRRARLRAFAVCGLGAAGLALVWLGTGWTPSLERIDPLTPVRIADAGLLALGAGLTARLARVPAAALFLLALARACALAGVLHPPGAEAFWGLGEVLTLTGLLVLAADIERESRRTLLLHVLRFNLVFLTLATSLTILLAEITRRQFVELSVLQIHDVAEFARGHLIQQQRIGQRPEDTLEDELLTERLIREFGRYPDLRRVRLVLDGHAMELAINDAGEISRRAWAGSRPGASRVTPADFEEARLLVEPVNVDGREVGHVELHHSIVRMNANIGRQMEAAFLVFTVFVFIGSAVTGVLVHVADRTIGRQYQELADAQRRLAQSDRLASVGAVASAVAHEINNPAGVLVARSDYLLSVLRDEPSAPAIQEDLETIRRQAQRIAKTVRDLLQSAARTRTAQDLVEVGGVATSAIALVRPTIRTGGVSFHWQPSPTPVFVWGDRDRLEQVLVNLLSNAAQAIRGQGQVTVAAAIRPGGAWADLVVHDTGSGIRAEDLGRIFDPFFTTKEPGAGTGLGLSIVRRIVHDHGGHIDVDTALGRGTEFRIALPAASAGVEPSPASARPPVPSPAVHVPAEDPIDA